MLRSFTLLYSLKLCSHLLEKYVIFFHIYSPASPKWQVLLLILFQGYAAYMCTAVRIPRFYTLPTEIQRQNQNSNQQKY